MAVALLPNLRENITSNNEGELSINVAGEWDRQQNLGSLANGLNISQNQDSQINSIPDLWARPEMFKNVLFASPEKYTFHQRFLGEWRGVLAILALKSIRGLNLIEKTVVRVPNARNIKSTDNPLLQCITGLMPTDNGEFQDPDSSDFLIQLLSYDKKPLALFWPEILVCPAVELEKGRNTKDVPWWDDKGLHDPISYLSKLEIKLLTVWVGNLLKNAEINKLRIAKLIEAFYNDLIAVNSESLADFGEDFETNVNEKLGLKNIFSSLDQGLVKKAIILDSGNENAESDIALKSSYDDTEEILLIFDTNKSERQLFADLGKDLSDIVVLGDYTANMFYDDFGNFCEERVKEAFKGIAVRAITADYFFLPKLTLLDGDGFKASSRNKASFDMGGEIYSVLWPIKQEILNYLSVNDLSNCLSVAYDGRDFVEITLKLPVSGRNKYISVTKQYMIEEDGPECILKQFPLIDIWPNFEMETPSTWQAYYSYYDNVKNNTFYAEPFWLNEKDVVERPIKLVDRTSYMQMGKNFPRAYFCYENKESNNETGLILLNEPEIVIPPNSRKFVIGVDFGTTNSVVYYNQQGGDDPKVLEFSNRIYEVSYSGTSNKEILSQHFIADAQQPHNPKSSIRSIFNEYNQFNVQELPLMMGNIYYPAAKVSTSISKDFLEQLCANNMKWKNGELDYTAMQGFLMELGLQALAEIVIKGGTAVEWTYSYPTAFSKRQKKHMENTWEQHVLRSLKQTCPSVTISLHKNGYSESDSVASFFLKECEAVNSADYQGMICLDIGGGSTDIALWNDSDHCSQSSIRLAGRNIINDYLYEKCSKDEELLDTLRMNCMDPEFQAQIDKLKDAVADKRRKEFDFYLENLLKNSGDSMIDAFSSGLRNSKSLELLHRDLAFISAGIFCYAGMLLSYMQEEEIWEAEKVPNFYIAGNASKIFNWLALHTDWEKANKAGMENMLIDMFKVGWNTENDVFSEVKISPLPKQEVAYGLVCKDKAVNSNLVEEKEAQTQGRRLGLGRRVLGGSKNAQAPSATIEKKAGRAIVVAGEYYVSATKACEVEIEDAMRPISMEDYKSLKLNGLDIFNDFIGAFNEFCEDRGLGFKKIVLDAREQNTLLAMVNTELIHKIKAANAAANENATLFEDELEEESIFIITLRKAYELLSKRTN